MPQDHSSTPLLLRSQSGGAVTLTLNRPNQRNALSNALMADLQDALEAIAADRSVHVVVLAAAGPVFCSGHDLKEITQEKSDSFYQELFDRCSKLMQTVMAIPQPVIAKVHAMATAAGCQLVATCDLAIAAEDARFATPGVNIGLFCSTPMVALSRDVGRKAAMEMLLTGEAIDAATAQRMGLINRAVPLADLDQAVAELAGKIAAKSRHVIGVGKQAFYRQVEMPVADAYAYASAVMTRNMASCDAAEGIDAFLAKRHPVWRNA